MTTTTARLGLIKPTDADPFVTEDIAANWQSIEDAVAGWLPAANLVDRPPATAEVEGFLFWAHDEGQVFICVDMGDGTYGWRSSGTSAHDSLNNLDADDAHPQYLLGTDHTKATHDALGIDAATLDGVSLEGLSGGHLTAMESGATFVNTTLGTSYTRVFAHQLLIPEEWQTLRVSAYGVAAFDGAHSSSEAHARIEIAGNSGPMTNISGGVRDLPLAAAHTVAGVANPFHTGGQSQIGVYLECKDPSTSGSSTVESAFVFAIATRES